MRSKVVAISLAALLLVAVVVVVLVVRDPDSKESATDAPTVTSTEPTDAATEPSPSPSEGHEHEGDHVDEVDPDIDPAGYEEFCRAFLGMADAYNSRVAERTPETIAAVEAAAEAFVEVGGETDLTDEVRAGLSGFVADVLEKPNEATPEEQGAFSTFLNSACPA
jgi:hypothetical protein